MNGIKYIKETFSILELILQDSYTGDLCNDKLLLDSVESINKECRRRIEDYIVSLEVEKRLYDSLETLTDNSLLQVLEKILSTVKVVYKDNLVLLKYTDNIYLTGWHNLAKECRGKVLDKTTLEIVSYPFDKFYNLDENEYTSKENILDLITKATSITIADKVDGSTISIVKYNGELLITTNGSFNADQIPMARQLIGESYRTLEKNLKEKHTYIFEIIYPENQIVVDYGDEQTMYLLAVRDNNTTRFLTEAELALASENIGTPLVHKEAYTSLDDFINKQKDEFCNKEGWVFYLTLEDEDFLFKMKYIEYSKMHKVINKLSFKGVYEVFAAGNIDDVLANTSNEKLKTYIKEFEEILSYIDDKIRNEVKLIKSKINDEMEFKHVVNLIETDILKPYIIKSLKNKNTDTTFNIKSVTHKRFVNIIKVLDDRFISSKSIIQTI